MRALDLKLRFQKAVGPSGEAYHPGDSMIFLVLPASTDPFRIEKAFNEKKASTA